MKIKDRTGIERIALERAEQFGKHERNIERDVRENSDQQLRIGAIRLLFEEPGGCPMGWNKELWLKMTNKPLRERMVIAAALLAAEIDRLSYLEDHP